MPTAELTARPAAGRRPLGPEGISWGTVTGLGVIHAAGLAGLVYLILRPSLATAILAGVMYLLGGLCHHRGVPPPVRSPDLSGLGARALVLAAFGASTFQNSALSWSADHRAHHADTDGTGDPHAITKASGWPTWVGCSAGGRPRPTSAGSPISAAVRSIRLQHPGIRSWPSASGWSRPGDRDAVGRPVGGLLVVGFLRSAVLLQATFCVNSLAHLLGTPPLRRRVSARDSLVTALVTFGEGYHNFHHRFPYDYRNGVHWWQYDPSKWLIWSFLRPPPRQPGPIASAERWPEPGRRRAV